MSTHVGVWIDHKKAVIVSIAGEAVRTQTLRSHIGPHPHYAGSQEGRSTVSSEMSVAVETVDKLTDAQMVAKVTREHTPTGARKFAAPGAGRRRVNGRRGVPASRGSAGRR